MSQSPRPEGPLLEVGRLAVTFYTPRGTVRAVRDASLEIRRGEVLGLVGESGSGKSTVAFALMGYLPGTAQVDGTLRFAGRDIAHLTPSELRELRGNRMAMVYQDPATSLNPAMRVGPQIEEVLREHLALNARAAMERTAELFDSVGLADPAAIGRRYPHELSGGMQQRVMIAMALASDPDLLILDEPTTGLDVTTEATILDLVVDLKDRVNAGILFVSHNLGVIARVADRVIVMYAGQTVEQAPVREIFKNPSHPYTAGLLSCMPQPPGLGEATTRLRRIAGTVYGAAERAADTCLFAPRCPMAQDTCRSAAPAMAAAGANHQSRCFYWDDVRPEIWGEPEPRDEDRSDGDEQVLDAQGLQRLYGQERRKYILFGPPVRPPVRALNDVGFRVDRARTLGIVGESGSGKTTLARAVVGLVAPDRGEIRLRDSALAGEVEQRTSEERAALRMVFQNPTASLNPKLPIRHTIIRSLRKFAGLDRRQSRARAAELLQAMGLDPSYLDRLPGELSGGEKQRAALAGAFRSSPGAQPSGGAPTGVGHFLYLHNPRSGSRAIYLR